MRPFDSHQPGACPSLVYVAHSLRSASSQRKRPEHGGAIQTSAGKGTVAAAARLCPLEALTLAGVTVQDSWLQLLAQE